MAQVRKTNQDFGSLTITDSITINENVFSIDTVGNILVNNHIFTGAQNNVTGSLNMGSTNSSFYKYIR